MLCNFVCGGVVISVLVCEFGVGLEVVDLGIVFFLEVLFGVCYLCLVVGIVNFVEVLVMGVE